MRPLPAVTVPFHFVPQYELAVCLGDARHPATTTGEGIGDLPAITEHLRGPERGRPSDFRTRGRYSGIASSAFARLMRGWPGLTAPDVMRDHVTRKTPRDYETFRRMRPGDRYRDAIGIAEERFALLLEERRRKAVDVPVEGTPAYEELRRSVIPPYPIDKFADKWRKMDPLLPVWTIPAHLAKDAYSHIHYDGMQARTISVREAARLQSFPDGFEFAGNMGDCFTQIGNAVPPLVAWSIAYHLLGLLGLPRGHAPAFGPPLDRLEHRRPSTSHRG